MIGPGAGRWHCPHVPDSPNYWNGLAWPPGRRANDIGDDKIWIGTCGDRDLSLRTVISLIRLSEVAVDVRSDRHFKAADSASAVWQLKSLLSRAAAGGGHRAIT